MCWWNRRTGAAAVHKPVTKRLPEHSGKCLGQRFDEVCLANESPVDLAAAQERALDLKHTIEDRYGLYILVRVVPETP